MTPISPNYTSGGIKPNKVHYTLFRSLEPAIIIKCLQCDNLKSYNGLYLQIKDDIKKGLKLFLGLEGGTKIT